MKSRTVECEKIQRERIEVAEKLMPLEGEQRYPTEKHSVDQKGLQKVVGVGLGPLSWKTSW